MLREKYSVMLHNDSVNALINAIKGLDKTIREVKVSKEPEKTKVILADQLGKTKTYRLVLTSAWPVFLWKFTYTFDLISTEAEELELL